MRGTLSKVMAAAMVCVMLLAMAGMAMAAPDQPVGMKQKKVTANSVTFIWKKVKSAAKYEIYRSDRGDGEYARVAVGKANSFTDKGLQPGSRYFYFICALDKRGERGNPCDKFTVITPGAGNRGAANAAKAPTLGTTNATLDAEFNKIVDGGKYISNLNEQYLRLLNAERANVGAGALTISTELMKTAAVKAADLYNYNYFSHTSPTYGELQTFALKFTGHEIGENIMEATGAWNRSFANAAVLGNTKFMESPTHRANRLTAGYKTVGFCIYQGPSRIVIVEHFYF